MDKHRHVEHSGFKGYVAEIKPLVHHEIMNRIADAERGADNDAKWFYDIVREYPSRPSGYRRPGLVMLVAEMFGVPKEESYKIAAVIQMTQEWVLVHDDIMDGAKVRSGLPTLHMKYGIPLSITVGDTLHMIADSMLSEFGKSAAAIGTLISSRTYNTLLRTSEGQAMDVNFIGKSLEGVTMERYLHIVKEKTCRYSVMDPMVIGAMLANQPENVIRALETVGAYAGVAFQIKDDILDMIADEAKFGKQRYGDLYEGKLTAIIIYTYQSATQEERAMINSIYAKKREDKTAEEIRFLVETIEKYSSIEKATELAKSYGEQAELALMDAFNLLPDNSFRPIFVEAIREMYTRDK
ncbi:MAG: polyprenyl synthetase family protein [Candidatus Micrarchaeota archaeon]|nr:polyprenyl synthetase family protein [Candidatus Micrarchaeota archaeon]